MGYGLGALAGCLAGVGLAGALTWDMKDADDKRGQTFKAPFDVSVLPARRLDPSLGGGVGSSPGARCSAATARSDRAPTLGAVSDATQLEIAVGAVAVHSYCNFPQIQPHYSGTVCAFVIVVSSVGPRPGARVRAQTPTT